MRRITVWLVVALLAQISSLSVAQAARWTTIESAGVHAAREETTFSPCGGNKLCLLGGRGQAPTPVLDTETLTWSNGPAPPIEMHHFQGVVGPDGCAWIFGAWTGPFPGEVAVPDIYKYCAESSKWEVVGKMSRPRGAGAAVYYKGNFYVASGNVGGHKVDADTVKWFDKYDPVTKVWTVMPDVPHPRDHVGAGILGNKLYLVGGRDSGGADYPHFFDLTEPNVDVYDFGAGSWSTLDDEFPAPRAGASVVKYKGALWIAGGEGSGKAWDQVDILKGSSFSSGPKMPNPRHGFGLVSCNGVLWVAGGAGTEGGGVSQTMLDAYYSGSKPKACTFSGTSTTQPSSSPSLSGSPPSNPSSATSGKSSSSSPSPNASTLIEAPMPTPSNSAVSIPVDEPAADSSTKTPVESQVPSEPEKLPASQPTPIAVPEIIDPIAAPEIIDPISLSDATVTATPGKSTSTPKRRKKKKHPPSPSISASYSNSKSYSTETSPEPSIAFHTSVEESPWEYAEESMVVTADTPFIAGINNAFGNNQNMKTKIEDASESDENMTGIDLEPKKKDGGVGGNDDSSYTNGESDSANINEYSNTFLSPSVIPTPEISMPVLNFSLDNVPTLLSLNNDEPLDNLDMNIDISVTPEPGLDGVPIGADGGESSSSEKACFPGHATVRLFDGSIKNMDALQTGDRVLVAHPDQYSEVFFFSHKHPHHVSNFVSLKTDSEFALHVSARHLVYANGELTEARNVRLGDILSVAHQTETATVTSVNRIVAKGLYNPHTLHGNIIVDNIAASTLTRSVHPRVAKAFLIPFNAVYRVLGPHEYVDTLNRHVLRALDYFVW